MLKPIIGSKYQVDVDSMDVYLDDKIILKGNSKDVIKIEIEGHSYRINSHYAYILAQYELHFEGDDREWYFKIEIKPLRIKKRKASDPDRDILIPVFVEPLERDGYRRLPTFFKYEINESGVLRNYKTKQIIKTNINNTYVMAAIYCPVYNGWCQRPIHRLVAFAWKKNENYVIANVVNHKDGDKENNHESNVEWCTTVYNVKHANETGLMHVNKYFIKDLKSNTVKGPVTLREIGYHPGLVRQWINRKTRERPFKEQFDIIPEGGEWEAKLDWTPVKKVKEKRVIQVKDVKKWETGEEGWLLEFDTSKELTGELKLTPSKVYDLLSNGKENLIYNGFCIRYKKEDNWESEPVFPKFRIRGVRLTYQSGEVKEFDNLLAAAKHLGITDTTLYKKINNNIPGENYVAEYRDA